MRSRASLLCTYKSDHIASTRHAQKPPQREYMPDDDVLSKTPEKTQSGDVPPSIEPRSVTCVDEDSTSGLSHRLSVLEQLFQRAGHENLSNVSLKEIEARLSRIERHIRGSQLSKSTPPDKSELRIKLPHPHLRAEHEKTRLFGKTHWVHSLEQVQDAKTRCLPSLADHGNSFKSFLRCSPSRTLSSMEHRA